MNLTYKRATPEDIDILTDTRIKVLRAANQLTDAIDMCEVKKQSYDYKSKGITSISLEATEMGRPLYEKYGLVQMKNEMAPLR